MCGVPALVLNFDTYTVAANLNMEQSFPGFSSTSSGTNYTALLRAVTLTEIYALQDYQMANGVAAVTLTACKLMDLSL